MMNSKYINKVAKMAAYCLLMLTCSVFVSCNDWLDVNPKSQIKEEDHFDREGGYLDQLTGIYTKMTTTGMYGLNMGIGFTEVLSHTYDINPNSSWRYPNEFNYTDLTSEAIISHIWENTYSCIANANILIRNISS